MDCCKTFHCVSVAVFEVSNEVNSLSCIKCRVFLVVVTLACACPQAVRLLSTSKRQLIVVNFFINISVPPQLICCKLIGFDIGEIASQAMEESGGIIYTMTMTTIWR